MKEKQGAGEAGKGQKDRRKLEKRSYVQYTDAKVKDEMGEKDDVTKFREKTERYEQRQVVKLKRSKRRE